MYCKKCGEEQEKDVCNKCQEEKLKEKKIGKKTWGAMKIISLIVAIAVIILIRFGYYAIKFSVDEKGFDDYTANEITEMMKEDITLPVMLDEVTRLDDMNMSYKKDLIIYKYTLIDNTKEDFLDESLNSLLRDGVVEGYCNSSDLAMFRDNGVSASYQYSDKNNEIIESIYVNIYTDC